MNANFEIKNGMVNVVAVDVSNGMDRDGIRSFLNKVKEKCLATEDFLAMIVFFDCRVISIATILPGEEDFIDHLVIPEGAYTEISDVFKFFDMLLDKNKTLTIYTNGYVGDTEVSAARQKEATWVDAL